MQTKDRNANVTEENFTEEQTRNQLKMSENDILQGLMDACADLKQETALIQVVRKEKTYFQFHIRPLSEAEYEKCRKKHTKFIRNRQIGVTMPGDTDNVKYRADLIYTATTDEDREKTWDNKQLWSALTDRGVDILTGLDVIDAVLKSGEKDQIVDQIDKLSGYKDSNLEEVEKN